MSKKRKSPDGSVDQSGSAGRQEGKSSRENMHSSFHIRITASKSISKEELDQWISGSMDQAIEPDLVSILKLKFAGGRVSLEKGQGGQAHFQCTVLTGKTRQRRKCVRDFLEDHIADLGFPEQDYCEPCRNTWASAQYCAKEDTHIAGPWEWGLNTPKNRDLKKEDLPDPRPWQEEILFKFKDEPEPGTSVINWFYDEAGQVGKTTLAKMLCMTGKWYLLDGSAQKMKFQAAKNPYMGYIVNLTRSKEEHVSYDGLEAISDGFFCDTFGSDQKGMCMRKPSHILVFANFRPDMEKLSKGRIKLYEWNTPLMKFA